MKSKPKARYLFRKTPLPADTDTETAKILEQLKNVRSKEDYLWEAYNLITKKFESSRAKTLARIWELFSTNTEYLFNRPGFMHCTNQNYLLANVLVKSGRFVESDISPSWTAIWYFSPHQYLKVRTGKNKITNVDCWARHYGVKFGHFAKGLNTTITKSLAE